MKEYSVTRQMAQTHPYVYQKFAYELGYSCEVFDGIIEGGALRVIWSNIDIMDWNNAVSDSYREDNRRY